MPSDIAVAVKASRRLHLNLPTCEQWACIREAGVDFLVTVSITINMLLPESKILPLAGFDLELEGLLL